MPFVDHKPEPKDERCRHPEHNPPGHIVLPAGTHTYQCPGCGQQQTFRVTRPTLGDHPDGPTFIDEGPHPLPDLDWRFKDGISS
jgi:hypothetical protein